MEIIKTIVPIFAVILIGLLAERRGFMPKDFLASANRLTYYFAIPAMVLRAIVNGDFDKQFDSRLLFGTLLSMVLLYLAGWILAIFFKLPKRSRGTFIDGGMHGNIGYIGFAVVFYYLGDSALAQAGIIGGFMMVIHNLFAVIVMQFYSEQTDSSAGIRKTAMKVLLNPIILTAILGILLSYFKVELPVILDRTLSIVGSLALPLALLVIGASLTLKIQSTQVLMIVSASIFKLMFLPATGYWLFNWMGLSANEYLPGLILLTCPVATVVYILSSELKSDTGLAVNLISVTTALSAITISFWLSVAI